MKKQLKQGRSKTFAHYELVGELGKGGMGIVYKAKDLMLKRECALKVLLPSVIEDKRTLRRFVEEARAVAKLKHPNIVDIYEAGTSPTFFFTMEYVEGVTLKEWILQKARRKQREILKIFVNICKGVEYAHHKKIIHRDLKPQNIMLNQQNEPKVMDFGLARQLDSGRSLSLSGEIVGTPTYMAPEVAYGSKGDERSDIYSLGAILYEMVTNKTPLEGETTLEIFFKLANSEIVAPSQLNSSISKDLETVCLHALNKEPEERYQTVKFLRREVENILANKPIATRSPGVFEKTFKWCKRYPLVALLLLLTISASFLASGFYYKERQTSKEERRIREELLKSKEAIRKQADDILEKARQLEKAKLAKEEFLRVSQENLGKGHLQAAQYQISMRNFTAAAHELTAAYEIFHAVSPKRKKLRESYLAEIIMRLQHSVLPHLPRQLYKISWPYSPGYSWTFNERYLALKTMGKIFCWDLKQINHSKKFEQLENANYILGCPPHQGPICLSNDDSILTCVDQYGLTRYDVQGQRRLLCIPLDLLDYRITMATSKDMQKIIIRDQAKVLLFNAAKKQLTKIVRHKDTPLDHWQIKRLGLAVSYDGFKFALNSSWGIDIQDIRKKEKTVLKHLGGNTSCLRFSPNNKSLVYGDSRGRLIIYDIKDGFRWMFTAHENEIRDIAFSADGRLFASGDCTGKVFIWDSTTRKKVNSIQLEHGVANLRFVNTGSDLLILSQSDTQIYLQRWTLEPDLDKTLLLKEEEQRLIRPAQKIVSNIDYFYQNPILISATGRFVFMPYFILIFFWDIENGIFNQPSDYSRLQITGGEFTRITGICLSSDEKWIAIIGRNSEVVIKNTMRNHVPQKINLPVLNFYTKMAFFHPMAHFLFILILIHYVAMIFLNRPCEKKYRSAMKFWRSQSILVKI